jgi:archaellum biogenesis ATPase FlaH
VSEIPPGRRRRFPRRRAARRKDPSIVVLDAIDRILSAKATGLRNLPFHSIDANALPEIIMTATDLVARSKLIGCTAWFAAEQLDRHVPMRNAAETCL